MDYQIGSKLAQKIQDKQHALNGITIWYVFLQQPKLNEKIEK